ncbi:MAG: hypothetical protein H7A23_18360 [Leptospiraceae bacterium]|nr:hypothetical protein [Leptospiraceae bacterium]MCP5496514.1 hypothetical protein [Leptospiraceae bacterium]
MGGIIYKIIWVLIGIGVLYLTYEGINTNKLQLVHGKITREQHPMFFWIFVVFYIFVGFFLIISGIFS